MIAVEPEAVQSPYQSAPIRMWKVGIIWSDGTWHDDGTPPKYTLTPQEAWAIAGLMTVALGLPVRGVDVTAEGQRIQ